jgi:hypothetical protein
MVRTSIYLKQAHSIAATHDLLTGPPEGAPLERAL